MNTQESWFLYEGASHLGSQGGTLRVEAGQVWLTRSGDLDDHILRAGEAFQVPPGDALVEPWHAGSVPARIVWEPRSRFEAWRSLVRQTFAHCWDLVDPRRRVVVGSVAAMLALTLFGLLFGPVSNLRATALAAVHASGTVLHNAGQERRLDGREAGERRGIVAKEARRGAAGAA